MEIDNYPVLVNSIWEMIQGTPDDRERIDFLFSEQQIVGKLGITYGWESDPCVFGVAQVLNDLVDMGYCKGRGSLNGHRWGHVAPSADCPDMLPTASFITPPLPKLPTLRRRVLQFIHEQSVHREEGITFYIPVRIPHEETTSALLPTTNEIEMFSARGQVIQALSSLNEMGFVAGSIAFGVSTLRITLRGACWLLIMQPLLKLAERAAGLEGHPETVEAVQSLIDAYGETQRKAAPILYVAIEKLENAIGGERKLIASLGQSRPYISDLKQSLQQYRHAETQAQIKLSYQQCLERATEIIKKYIAQRE
ncbi:MAG: hypothetical protein ACRDF4_04695 [Rhabdochlamydiaceae bacterium]